MTSPSTNLPATMPEAEPAPAVNPMETASAASLDELFSRDPLKLSDQEIDVIVAELRRARAKWLVTENAPKAKKAAAATKAPKVAAPANISLDDLGL